MSRSLRKLLSFMIVIAVVIGSQGALVAYAVENNAGSDQDTVVIGISGNSGAGIDRDTWESNITPLGFSGVELNLTTASHLITPGEYFSLEAAFTEKVNGNTAILRYSFDGEMFEYSNFTSVGGVTAVDAEFSDGEAKITIIVPNYDMSGLGEIMLRAKEGAELRNTRSTVSLIAEYVVRDASDNKEIRIANASATFATLGTIKGDTNGDNVIDLVDLSNIIDWFGFDTSHPEWYEEYLFFDFNNNGEIDISDICYVAANISSRDDGHAAGIDSIKIASLPAKITYIQGERLDLSGMAVQMRYADGDTWDITELVMTSPVDGAVLDVVGLQTVTVSYANDSATKSTQIARGRLFATIFIKSY